jgi:hypothetical protein
VDPGTGVVLAVFCVALTRSCGLHHDPGGSRTGHPAQRAVAVTLTAQRRRTPRRLLAVPPVTGSRGRQPAACTESG